ncbi:MAG: hypothetical protein MI919_37375, partial [Holophagales bacterium]|nr:hypothetical protein [Holophagales bacterium]
MNPSLPLFPFDLPSGARPLLAVLLGIPALFGVDGTASARADQPQPLAPELERVVPPRHLPPSTSPEPRLATGSSAGTAWSRGEGRLPSRLPSSLVLSLDDAVDECLATAFLHRGEKVSARRAATSALLRALGELGAREVTPVHRRSAGDGTSAARLPISQLRAQRHGKLRQLLASKGARVGSTESVLAALPDVDHTYVVHLGADSAAEVAAGRLGGLDGVAWAEPVGVRFTHSLPDDPFVDPDGDGEWQIGTWGQDYPDQWALETMGWGQIWRQRDVLWTEPSRVGGGGVVIAILDTGVDTAHPDLEPNLWRSP